jgi:hypothetical protein
MNKSDIRVGDIIILANGTKETINKRNMYIIERFYADDLKCLTEENCDIIKIYRPVYELIFEKELDYDRDRKTTKGK